MEELKTYLQRTGIRKNSAQAGRDPDIQIQRKNVRMLRCKSSSVESQMCVFLSLIKSLHGTASEGQSVATHMGVKQTHGLDGKFPAAPNSKCSACRLCYMTISGSYKKEARRKVAQHDEE